jgi:hypothetical protein
MTSMNNKIKKMSATLFGKSEAQRRMAKNTVKMIAGDVVTLYEEFYKYKGLGALFFNPVKPDQSSYMTVKDLSSDKAVAEEMCDEPTADFLNKLINLIGKNSEDNKPIVVMLSDKGMSVHVLDLNQIEDRINEISDAAS